MFNQPDLVVVTQDTSEHGFPVGTVVQRLHNDKDSPYWDTWDVQDIHSPFNIRCCMEADTAPITNQDIHKILQPFMRVTTSEYSYIVHSLDGTMRVNVYDREMTYSIEVSDITAIFKEREYVEWDSGSSQRVVDECMVGECIWTRPTVISDEHRNYLRSRINELAAEIEQIKRNLQKL
jgi:hypothetical protein